MTKRIPHWLFETLRSHGGTRWRIWDFLVGWLAFSLGFYASPYAEYMPSLFHLMAISAAGGLLLSTCSRLCGVPNPEQRTSNYELLATSVIAVLLAYVLFGAGVYLVFFRVFGRLIIAIAVVVSLAGMVLPRLLIIKLLGARPLGVVIYGIDKAALELTRELHEKPGFRMLGFIDDSAEFRDESYEDAPVLGTVEQCDAAKLRGIGANVVVLCIPQSQWRKVAAELLALPLANIDVLDRGAFLEQHFQRVTAEDVFPHWFGTAPTVPANTPTFIVKRALDIVVAIFALLLTAWIWPIIALLIKLDSPGPAVFRQERTGRNGVPFTINKFRTMRQDAEANGAQWTTEKDPRITRIGTFLRLTRLDELPQLINVLRGDMSVVGPRPERPEFVSELSQDFPLYTCDTSYHPD